MKTSIVIPTYKRPGYAKKLKKQILKYEPSVEVIIVDQSNIKIPNTSVAKNEGIKKTTGDIIIFFDDDVEITQNTIRCHQLEYKNINVVGVAGRVINDGEIIPANTQVVSGQMNLTGTKFIKNFWGETRQKVLHPYGCNMSFRKKILEKVGYFDTNFPPPLSAFEEIDLGLNVSKFGDIIFSPKALVFHHRATSGGTRVDKKTRNILYYESYGRIIKKHIKFPLIFVSVGVLIVRIIREAPYSLTKFLKGLLS